jgi:CelD/BcsL family acetyltransferase involved in cellulose biosynthesis
MYTFAYKDRLFYYQSGFDPGWQQWSLGTVLIGYCIRDSISRGITEFHYLRGNEEYKSRWTKAVRQTRKLIVANRTVRGSMYASYLFGRTGLKRFLMARRTALQGEER